MALLDPRGLLRRCPSCDTAAADDAQRCGACGATLGPAGEGPRTRAGVPGRDGPDEDGAPGQPPPGAPLFGSAGGAVFSLFGLGAGTSRVTGAARGLADQFLDALGEVTVRLLGLPMGEQALDDNPYRQEQADAVTLFRRRIYKMLFPYRTGIREPQLLGLYRDLARYADAGVGFHDALARLQKSAKSPVLRRMLAEIRSDLLEGATLTEAFGRHAYVFAPLDLALIEVGENLGTVGDNMRLLVELIEERRELRDRIARKFVQPIALVFIANYVITLPIFIFDGLFGYLATIAIPTLVIGFAAVLFTVILPVLFAALGRNANDRIKLDLPGIGTIVRANALGRFARALGAAIAAGVEIEKSLRISAKATDNVIVREAIERSLPLVREHGLAAGLQRAGVLTEEVAAELAHGEATGTVAEALQRISADARARAARGTAILGSILAFTLILFSVLYAVYSVFVKMFAIAGGARESLIDVKIPPVELPFPRNR